MTNAIAMFLALSLGSTGGQATPGGFEALTVKAPSATIVMDERYAHYVRVDLELVNRNDLSPRITWSMGDQRGQFINPWVDTLKFAVYFSGDDIKRQAIDATVELLIQPDDRDPAAYSSDLNEGWASQSIPLHIDLKKAAKRATAFDDEWKFSKLSYLENQMYSNESINVPLKSLVSLVLKKRAEIPNVSVQNYSSYIPVNAVFCKDNFQVNPTQKLTWADPTQVTPGTYVLCLVVNGKEVDWRPIVVLKEGEGC